jgi:hypothetical protein
MLAAIDHQRGNMEPDDDWAAVAVFDGGRVVMGVPSEILPFGALGTLHRKLCELAATVDARWFCRVQTVWASPAPPDGSMPRPSEQPDRRELVVALLGDAEGMEALGAAIERRPGEAPRLGPWEPLKEPA